MDALVGEFRSLALIIVSTSLIIWGAVVLYKIVQGDKPWSAIIRVIWVSVLTFIMFQIW